MPFPSLITKKTHSQLFTLKVLGLLDDRNPLPGYAFLTQNIGKMGRTGV
jgi:hypothetical protein